MGLFKTLIGLGKVKSAEAAEKIEDTNRVGFAKQDLAGMETQLREARAGLGRVKAKLMGFERDIKEKSTEIETRTATVKQLKEANKVTLAKKNWEIVVGLKDEVEVLSASQKQFQGNYTQQKANVEKLESNLSEAKRSLKMMQTMQDVKNSNEALTTVDTSGSESCLSKFEERKKKMQEELDTSTAMLEEQNAGSAEDLDAQSAKALGTVKGQDEFDAL